MNIDPNQLQQIIQVVQCLQADSPEERPAPAPLHIDHGFCIVVADRGHVWVGKVVETDREHIISDARIIRYWGTERGLNQLAMEGPTTKTKLDAIADTVKVKNHAVIAIVQCVAGTEKWTK